MCFMPGSVYSRSHHYDEHRTFRDPPTGASVMSFQVRKMLIRLASGM